MSATDSLPPATPLDVRRGLTRASDVAFPLRWGILGAGSISAQWVESLRACKGATVTAVAAREQARAQAFADALGIPKAYDSYADMATAADVDIVYVGTITRLHKEHSLIAIEAGKHVLCEKPLAENVDGARAMYAAAEAKGVMLQDAMWTRFFPAVEHARHAIETGVIGDVSLVQSDFFDPIYTIQAAPLAFSADAVATKVTASGLRRGGAAIVEYGDRGSAVLIFPPFNCELGEVTEIAGTNQGPDHARPAGTLPDGHHHPRSTAQRGAVALPNPQRRIARAALRLPATRQRRHGAGIPQPARLPVPGRGRASLPGGGTARVPAIRTSRFAACDGLVDPDPAGATRVRPELTFLQVPTSRRLRDPDRDAPGVSFRPADHPSPEQEIARRTRSATGRVEST